MIQRLVSSREEREGLGHREAEEASQGPWAHKDGDCGALFTTQGTPQIAANTGSLERQEGSFPTALEGSAALPHADVQLGLRTVGMYLPL